MGLINQIKNIFKNQNNNLEQDSLVKVNTLSERDELVISISQILFDLYNQLKLNNNLRVILMLKIKDEVPSKNCTITNIEKFIQRINEKRTIIGYELLVTCNDILENGQENKIIVKVYDDSNVKIDYLNENGYEYFDKTLRKIQGIISNDYNLTVDINYIEKGNSLIENVDFGILNVFEYRNIQYRNQGVFDKEQIELNKRKILANYNKSLNEINKKIFFEMHKQLIMTDYNIWEYDGFEKIINIGLLPNNFYSLTKEEKREIIYLKGSYNYQDFWNIFQQEKPFWKLNNLKEDIRITNVIIDVDYKEICIEFNGVCNFFNAYISIKYEENYNISVFDPN